MTSSPEYTKEITLAGGCFWGVEKFMSGIYGVLDATSVYANGSVENPGYEQVCSGTTGAVEAVRVTYDPTRVSLPFLLTQYFRIIDPTSLNRQGNDVGTQYRTGIYYQEDADRSVIESAVTQLEQEMGGPVAIEVAPLQNAFEAEAYHQDYLDKNPGGYCHISPALIREAQGLREYQKPDEETLQESLTPMQYQVTQQNGTEPAYQNEYHDLYEPGIYVDITTGQPLFLSTDKFESGCGWPAFSKPIDDSLLQEQVDRSYGMERTEVRSADGDAHLGHVFEDGPQESGGLRYCINSASLRFIPREQMAEEGYAALLPLLGE